MKKLIQALSVFAAVWGFISRYPAAVAAIGNIIVVLGAAFGLHLNAAELATTASIVAGVFGVLVHAGVIPVSKVDNVKAGVKPTIDGKASMLTTPVEGSVGQ